MDVPQAIVRRHETADVSWESAERAARTDLRGIVLGYQDYEEQSKRTMRRLEVPFAGVPVVISFGQTWNVVGQDGRAEEHGTFAAGVAETWCVVESAGLARGVQINLTPIGARLVLGLPMSELTNRTVELRDVLGPVATSLTERLQEASTWETRFEILDQFIARRVASVGEPSVPVIWAWNKLRASGGRAPVGELANELGYTPKRLIAQFRDHVGLPPKTMARVIRFERAVRLLRDSGTPLGWAEIAYRCGYFDQAHFNREFREFAGRTPTEFAANLLPHGNGVTPD